MSKQPPQTIVIGQVRQGSQQFDDQQQLGQNEFKICGLKISLDEVKICGISFTYQDIKSGRKVICNDTNITGKNITTYEFEIPQNDYIQVIFGYYQDAITQLGLITYKGQQVIFGKDQGYKFNYLFMGYTFSKVFGSFKKGLQESLGFRVQKLPRDFVEQNYSPLVEILYQNNPYNSVILEKFETAEGYSQYSNTQQYPPQPVANVPSNFDGPTSQIIYQTVPSQATTQTSFQQNPYNSIPMGQQQPYQQNPYQQPPYSQPYPQQPYPQQGQNQVIVVQEQQPQQQYQQKSGPGFAGTMVRTAVGTYAAIETVRMIENIGHHNHKPNVVVMGGGHHHHHRR